MAAVSDASGTCRAGHHEACEGNLATCSCPCHLGQLGNPRFLELNEEERRIHVAKAAGYSGTDNPDTWANFREAQAWGASPLLGCLIRMGDKYRRAQNLMRNPNADQVGESLKDTLMDLSNYAKIAICLWEEEQAK